MSHFYFHPQPSLQSNNHTLMRLVPFYTLIKRYPRSTKDIQRTSNRQIHLPLTANVNLLQILKIPSTSGIGDRDRAPLGQLRHELLINALLKTLNICSVNEELGTVGLQERN